MEKNNSIKFASLFIALTILFSSLMITAPVIASGNSNKANFLVKPYLLAPKTDGMTISWETDAPVGAKVLYGLNGKTDTKIDVKCERGTPFKDNTEGIYMYRAELKELRPDTIYTYKVELASGITEEGTFKTLSENPKNLKIFTISDTHEFLTNEDFAKVVLEERPDFILHSGDFIVGTGFQKEQYAECWFGPGEEFLKHIPVVYAYGNHDNGPYFYDYFLHGQSQAYNSNKNGHNNSFNVGNTHFIMVNSNPWGFYEMNAKRSGFEVDAETKEIIDESVEWIEEDLKSEAAKNATWRVLVLHHPYTDDYTQKNIVDIVEKNNVDLVLSGHSHVYGRNVSVNPDVGAKINYITQGAARDYDSKINYGEDDKRILPDYPEMLVQGGANYGTLNIGEKELSFKACGIPKAGEASEVLDEFTISKEEPKIELKDISIKPINKDNHVLVGIEANVENKGNGIATANMEIFDGNKKIHKYLFGEKGKERVVVLNPGETKKIKTEIELLKPGKHVIKVKDVEKTINVPNIKNKKAFEFSNMRNRVGEGIYEDVVFTTAEVKNVSTVTQKVEVKYYIDNKIVNTKEVELKANEKKTVDFSHKFDKSGKYNIKVGDLRPEEIEIEGTLKGTPMIQDLSGNNNHAILRGKPIVTKNEKGQAIVQLREDGDYIEIPDSESLRVKDGYTAVVGAKVNRLAQPGEQDHNPLMIKGPSVGWGANYLLRIALRNSGIVAFGTCHGITEYAWDGGQANVGKWSQYTSSFDRNNGGKSYIDKEKVAEIGGISEDSIIRNWEGHPLLIGFSYKGHVHQSIGRPSYFTHLDADIGQVRFYTEQLTQKENNEILKNPKKVGPKSDKLAVWLDFDNINTKGIHTTEWRRPSEFVKSYKLEKQLWEFNTLTADVKVPGSSSIKAIVQVSDDMEKVKDSKTIKLKDGQNKIDISDLEKGQYVRVVTEFNSSLTKDATYIPELNEYKISANTEDTIAEICWNTKVDWNRGTFNGAVGFEPNRAVTIIQGTDIIH